MPFWVLFADFGPCTMLCAGYFFTRVVVVIIFLYGNDIYRRELKVRELLRINREKRKDADISIFDLEEGKDEWKKVRDFLFQPSMFSETKTAVVYESGVADIKEWRELLKKEIHSKENILIISDSSAPKKNFSFLLDVDVKTNEYKELEGKALDLFLKKEAEKMNVVFDKDVWNQFVAHIETFQSRSAAGIRELEKCSLFSKGKSISNSEFHLIIQTTKEEDVFGLARALVYEHDTKKRIRLLEQAFINKIDIPYLFNAIAYIAKGGDVERLAELDVKIKSGNADYEEALLQFVLTK